MRTQKPTMVLALVSIIIIVSLSLITSSFGQNLKISNKKNGKAFGKSGKKTINERYDPHYLTDKEDNDDHGLKKNQAIDGPSLNNGTSRKIDVHSISTNLSHTSKNISGIHPKERRKFNFTIADGICQDVDIRNNVDNFEVLKPCRVIEGFLQIVLLENQSEEHFKNLSFPELREITGYLLLYRVTSLKSMRNLFPNLEVIRGDRLLADYALMIYEMKNLQEIGLSKLTEISRGAVRIEKNPALCYAKSIDWDKIVTAGENFIKDNGGNNVCPGCSGCPDGHCWSAKDCQKTKKPKCLSQCLADCYGNEDEHCYVCKNYRHEERCIAACPPHLYSYLSRRCITKGECLQMNHLRHSNDDDEKKWRAFDGSCSTQCPDGFEDAIDHNNATTCGECMGRCRKIGTGAIIRHISDAQSLRGTNVIRGSLEFQIRNGNPSMMDELTAAFGMVEEITGSLKVTHSFPITSLGFFKKLRIIRGEKLESNNASLIILDNPNLSNLFPDNHEIKILNGRLFFHYNPKLCLSNIIRFGKKVGVANFTDMEVQPQSNGDKVACDIVSINITVVDKTSTSVRLTWTAYKPSEGQTLLSYLLNYIETDNQDISYDSNACGPNPWQIVDVEIPSRAAPVPIIEQLITDLKPYTKYAVYVKTLSAKDRNNQKGATGQSRIIFFTTKPDIPSVPTNLLSSATSNSEIIVKWSKPEQPNGPIGYYKITGFLHYEDHELLSSRNYCNYQLLKDYETDESLEVTSKTPTADTQKTCCQKEQAIAPKKFEIFCQDNMTITYLPHGHRNYCSFEKYNYHSDITELRDKSSSSMSSVEGTIRAESREILDDKKERLYNDTYYSFVFNVSANSSSYSLKKLRHYSLYTISVSACGEKLDNKDELCSSIEYTNTRTKKKINADNVKNVRVHVSNDTIVVVTWDQPRDPNGLTVAYHVDYMNIIVKDAKRTSECIPASVYRDERAIHIISNLSPGKYSVRVRTVSLSGDGNWSREVYFKIGIKNDNTMTTALTVTFVCLIALLIIGLLWFRNYQKRKEQERLIASVNPDYIESKYVRDSWEVSRENVEVLDELGLGNFGMVYRGILNGTTPVALKTVPDNATEDDKNEFLNEASVMKNFSTFHIIKLLGVISEGNPPFVVMELMENGDLKTYLRKIRDTALAPDVPRIIRMACEIADGMAYLESKKFIHRDLAARNCMVSYDIVCKIGDFGMARDIYETDYYKIGQKGLLPIRWMAPENLSDGVFTSDSDVWSFGVVLYEILTLGELPYQGFSNDEVLNHVLRKGTVNIPRNCPEIMIKLMEKCFKWRPSERPTFMEIVAELEPFVGQDFCEKSFYHSDEGIEVRNAGLKKVYHHAAQIRFHWGNETARWVREFEDNVTLLDQSKASSTSRGRIFKNGFQHFGNVPIMEDIPLDR